MSAPQRHLLGTALTMHLDRFAGRLCASLDEATVPCILLKGPALAGWLYAESEARSYEDVDVLVPTERVVDAEAILEQHGLRPVLFGAAASEIVDHAKVWRSETGPEVVDLHHTLAGVGAGPTRCWEVLSRHVAVGEVGGERVQILDEPARTMLSALHAGAHGARVAGPLEDLRRTLARVDDGGWREAWALAASLEAQPAMLSGLRLVDGGRRTAERLGFDVEIGADQRLRAGSPPHLAPGLAALARRRGLPAKAALVGREVVPTAAFQREWSPLARSGIPGLALSYLWRPVWLALHLPRALHAWVRASRGAA